MWILCWLFVCILINTSSLWGCRLLLLLGCSNVCRTFACCIGKDFPCIFGLSLFVLMSSVERLGLGCRWERKGRLCRCPDWSFPLVCRSRYFDCFFYPVQLMFRNRNWIVEIMDLRCHRPHGRSTVGLRRRHGRDWIEIGVPLIVIAEVEEE